VLAAAGRVSSGDLVRKSAHRLVGFVVKMARSLHHGIHEIFPPEQAAIQAVEAAPMIRKGSGNYEVEGEFRSPLP